MKEEKGITLVTLVFTIVILVIIISITANVSIKLIKESQLQDLKTNMLLIQAKAKEYSEEVSFQTANLDSSKEEDNTKIQEIETNELVGTKLNEDSPDAILAMAKTAGIDDINGYYYLDKEDLEKMGINLKLQNNEYYFIKYDFNDTEIVYSKGFVYNDNTYYKLSDLNNL